MKSEPPHTVQPQQAKISIIIPCYQVEAYIAECLESVIHQSFPLWEVICVDDCGTDRTATIVEKYARRDNRIRLVRNERNMGLASSRNEGIRHSTAPFIMFLDSDDAYDLSMCEKMYEAIVSSGADVAMCGTQIHYECDFDLKKSDDDYYSLKFDGFHRISDELLNQCDVSACNKIYRRELLERYEIRFPDGLKYEDAYFFNAYMAHATSIFFVHERLYQYRLRAGSIMNQTFAHSTNASEDHLKIAFEFYEHLRRWDLLEKKYAYFCQFFRSYVWLAVQHSPSAKEGERLMEIAGVFAALHLRDTNGLDEEIIQWLTQLRLSGSARIWGGLLRVRADRNSIRYSCLGITLYKIKYKHKRQKHYLLGVPILSISYS